MPPDVTANMRPCRPESAEEARAQQGPGPVRWFPPEPVDTEASRVPPWAFRPCSRRGGARVAWLPRPPRRL